MQRETILPLRAESREQVFLILGWLFVFGFGLWIGLRFVAVFVSLPGIPLPNHFLILELLILAFIVCVFLRDIYGQLGRLYGDQNQLKQALKYYHWARRLNPLHLPTYTALGNVLGDLGDWEAAQPYYEKVLAKRPDAIDALNGLAHVHLMRNEWRASYDLFKQAYLYKRGIALNQSGGEHRKVALTDQQKRDGIMPPVYKLQHDIEQFDYLLSQSLGDARFEAFKSTYAEILAALEKQAEPQLNWDQQRALQGIWAHNLYFEAPGAVEGKAILLPCNADKLEQTYLKAKPAIMYYDGFLQPDILKALRNFCLRSTIWHDASRQAGYLGSNLDDGFNCPLLYQIADALRARFPRIFKDYPLIYMWAFKCDSQRQGVALHTDSAFINVNFWITPDAANLDPEHGGINVYTAEPPPEWDFQENRIDMETMRQYLKEKKSGKISIPYRQNRVVIFDSRLFHETDQFRFKPGYENRRINITLLFGNKALKFHDKPFI